MTTKKNVTTESSLVSKSKLSDIIKTDATIDMNSIVAYFISKYELSLFEQKKAFSDKIKELTKYLEGEFITEVEADIKLPSFNIKIKNLDWQIKATLVIQPADLVTFKKVTIQVFSDSREFSINGRKLVVVSDDIHKKYVDITNEINEQRTELYEVLNKIQNIARKEREIRGALAEKTLREAGVDLFDSPELLNLITLPSISIKTVNEIK